jgi:hypothetical protein
LLFLFFSSSSSHKRQVRGTLARPENTYKMKDTTERLVVIAVAQAVCAGGFMSAAFRQKRLELLAMWPFVSLCLAMALHRLLRLSQDTNSHLRTRGSAGCVWHSDELEQERKHGYTRVLREVVAMLFYAYL